MAAPEVTKGPTVAFSQRGDRSVCDVLILKDRAGLATILTFLEKGFRARIVERHDGPAALWVDHKDRPWRMAVLTFFVKVLRALVVDPRDRRGASRWVLATPHCRVEVVHDGARGNQIISPDADSDDTVRLMGETLREFIASQQPLDKAPNAWSFRSDLTLRQMLQRVQTSPPSWFERDSEWKPDSISGRLVEGASARIFEHGMAFYVVNLGLAAESDDPEALRDHATKRLLDEIIPLLGGRRVRPTGPVD
jgi:hypothetical protein